MVAKKKKISKGRKPKLSKKRLDEIEATFKALSLPTTRPYQGPEYLSNQFQRVSIYETNGYTFSISNNSYE